MAGGEIIKDLQEKKEGGISQQEFKDVADKYQNFPDKRKKDAQDILALPGMKNTVKEGVQELFDELKNNKSFQIKDTDVPMYKALLSLHDNLPLQDKIDNINEAEFGSMTLNVINNYMVSSGQDKCTFLLDMRYNNVYRSFHYPDGTNTLKNSTTVDNTFSSYLRKLEYNPQNELMYKEHLLFKSFEKTNTYEQVTKEKKTAILTDQELAKLESEGRKQNGKPIEHKNKETNEEKTRRPFESSTHAVAGGRTNLNSPTLDDDIVNGVELYFENLLNPGNNPPKSIDKNSLKINLTYSGPNSAGTLSMINSQIMPKLISKYKISKSDITIIPDKDYKLTEERMKGKGNNGVDNLFVDASVIEARDITTEKVEYEYNLERKTDFASSIEATFGNNAIPFSTTSKGKVLAYNNKASITNRLHSTGKNITMENNKLLQLGANYTNRPDPINIGEKEEKDIAKYNNIIEIDASIKPEDLQDFFNKNPYYLTNKGFEEMVNGQSDVRNDRIKKKLG